MELKLIRPFGDNGVQAEHWSENLLHPYCGNVSAIGDCLKLVGSRFTEKKAIIVFGYEHAVPAIDIAIAIESFEQIVRNVLRLSLSARSESRVEGLIHPHHQRAFVYGWQVGP